MTTTLNHDGYVATISMDFETGLIHGQVINTRDVLTFAAPTLPELQAEFAATITDYIEWCKAEGSQPERPYSGTMSLRLPPEVHRMAAVRAAEVNISLNSWIVQTVECALDQRPANVTQSELTKRLNLGVREEVRRVLGSRTLLDDDAFEGAAWTSVAWEGDHERTH